MHYSEFSTDQQKASLRQRIAAWEADHFGHEVNKQALAALPASEDKDTALKQANEAQATLESSINAAKAYLDHLNSPPPAA